MVQCFRFCSVYNNSLLSVAQKRIYPFQCLPTYASAKQFALKEPVWWGAKCFLKIQNECIDLSSIIQDFSPIIYYSSQLSFTTVPFCKCMLLFEHSMSSSNLEGTQPVRRDDNYMREPCHHSLGISSVSRDCWKRWAKTDTIQLQAPLGLKDEAHQALKLSKGSNL